MNRNALIADLIELNQTLKSCMTEGYWPDVVLFETEDMFAFSNHLIIQYFTLKETKNLVKLYIAPEFVDGVIPYFEDIFEKGGENPYH